MPICSLRNSLIIKRTGSLHHSHFLTTLIQAQLSHIHPNILGLLRDAFVIFLGSDFQKSRIEMAKFLSFCLLVDAEPILLRLILAQLRGKSAHSNTRVRHMRDLVVPVGFARFFERLVVDVPVDELLPILVRDRLNGEIG